MVHTRPAAVAGRFYPREVARLTETVDRLLDTVEVLDGEPLAPAYVVPHAGYIYSGPTAAHVFARLRRQAERIDRVVLIGPAHYVPLVGCAAPAATSWATPLGELPVEDAAGLTEHLMIDDGAHAPEHSLEVQLPFLQRALGRPVPILPIAVGQAGPAEVAAVLDAVGIGPGTELLCSTDLSHYLDLAAATERDSRTATAVTDLAPERISRQDACGVFALHGLLTWARDTAGLRPELLDLSTSADTAGDPSRVVGYGAFALY